jgi:hypothetical protein
MSGFRDQAATHHERFLVRERDPLPTLERSQRGVEPRCPHDRVQHDIDVISTRRLDQAPRPSSPVWLGSPALDEADEGWTMRRSLLAEACRVCECCQSRHGKAIRMPAKHSECRGAD